MGDVADMMLDGTLCGGCGAHIESGEPQGFPRYCSEKCAPAPSKIHSKKQDKVQCPQCKTWVKKTGLDQHVSAKHSVMTEEEFKNLPPGNYVISSEAGIISKDAANYLIARNFDRKK